MTAGLLAGKRILVTGVTTHRSIAFAVAREAQAAGAEIALTSFGARRPMTERAARRLDGPPPVLELDVRRQDDLDALAAELERRWGRLDGLVHAIACAPPEAMSRDPFAAPVQTALEVLETSALSLHTLAGALTGLLEKAPRASVVGLDFDASVAWPGYGWMGVAKAGLESISRNLAVALGPSAIRVNLVSSGPLDTPSALGTPSYTEAAAGWSRGAPLGWDVEDAGGVAHGVCFFLSDWSRQVTGEILHVDGGHHAVGHLGADAGDTPDGARLERLGGGGNG